jgi:hypothetical protein
VEAHAQGPAVLEAGTAPALDEVRPDGLAGSTRAAAAPESAALQEERRGSPRRAYVQHVIALGTEAGRVLVGRDISLGGMRVDPHPDLRVGDALRIGLHLRAREKPLVLDARVARNDGAEGFVLQFRSLSAEAEGYLRSMVNFLPILAVRPPGEEDRGVILSEILDSDGAEAG